MTYEKTNWQAGDTITSEKLNHLEDGVGEAFIAPPIEGTDVGKVLGVTQDAEENPVYGLVSSSVGPIIALDVDGVLDKTVGEILTAVSAGQPVCLQLAIGGTPSGAVYAMRHYLPIAYSSRDNEYYMRVAFFYGTSTTATSPFRGYVARAATDIELLNEHPSVDG